MITYQEVGLMYPALDGLGSTKLSCSCDDMTPDISFINEIIPMVGLAGLGCGGDSNCSCNKNKKKGLGAWDSWYCDGTLAPLLFSGCMPPAPVDIAANDNSNFGGHLSQANRDVATAMAIGVVKNDPSLQTDNPMDYSGLLVIAGVLIGGALLLK